MIKAKITEYSLCELPEGIDATAYTIRVQYAGHGRWAVRWGAWCLSWHASYWDYEPTPSDRTDEWLNWHRFNSLRNALAAARMMLPTLTVNGKKARELLVEARP